MKPRTTFLVTLLISTIYLLVFYARIIINPNGYLFSIDVDGLNNYYSFAYHIKHDPHYFQFDGMQYPYGEYLQFVDCNPAIANILKFTSEYIIELSPYSIGILNTLMLWSIAIAAGIISLILTHFRVPSLPSILGGVGIAMLSSQSLLWTFGHWALTLTCFFPIGWFLLIRSQSTQRNSIWSLLAGLNTLFWLFVHSYLGMILLLFSMGTLIIRSQIRIRRMTDLIIQVVSPVTIVLVMIHLFDPHGGRFDWPFITEFRSSVWSLLYPVHSDLKPIFDGFLKLLNVSPPSPEKQPWLLIGTYIGLPACLAVCSCAIWLIYMCLKRNYLQLQLFLKHEMFAYLISSLLVLLYAMGIPFRFVETTFIESLPFLSQFIGLGRFAWAFYYVVTVAAFVWIYNFAPKQLATALLVLTAGVMIFESVGSHRSNARQISQFPNFFEDDRLGKSQLFSHEIDRIDFDQFQAILPLPFFFKWNTPYDFGGSNKSEQLSIRLSYYSGLPLFGTFLARPSLSLGHEIIQLFSPTHSTQKGIKDALHHDKPILIIWSKEKLGALENNLLQKAELLFENDIYALFSLPLARIFDFDRESWIAEFNHAHETGYLDISTNYILPDSNSNYYYNGFEDRQNAITFRGQGAYEREKDQMIEIFRGNPNSFNAQEEYSISFWFYNKGNQHAYCTMWLQELGPDDSVIQSIQFQPFASQVFERNWAYNEQTIRLSESANTLSLKFLGNAVLENQIFIDELLIRPKHFNMYKFTSGHNGEEIYIKNNYSILVE